MKWLSVACVLALGSAAVGCVAAERMTAGRQDYTLYREFRLADTPLERLKHGNRYLKEVPQGRFRAEVASWFRSAEPAFYRMAHDRPSLLRAYLAALPDGPHAEQVIDRVIELEMLRQYRDEQAKRRDSKLNRALVEVSEADVSRKDVLAKLTSVTRLAASLRSFGKPSVEFAEQLLVGLPTADRELACSADRCKRRLELRYAIPGDRRLDARQMILDIELGLERGVVQSILLSGPELWSRLSEVLSVAAVPSGDFTARVDAISRSVSFVENVTAASLPAAACRQDVVAPVVLARRCDGILLEAFAGTEPNQADGLRVTPAPSQSTVK